MFTHASYSHIIPFAASLPPSSVLCSLRSPFHYPPEAPRAPGPKGPDPARGAARRMEWEWMRRVASREAEVKRNEERTASRGPTPGGSGLRPGATYGGCRRWMGREARFMSFTSSLCSFACRVTPLTTSAPLVHASRPSVAVGWPVSLSFGAQPPAPLRVAYGVNEWREKATVASADRHEWTTRGGFPIDG